jgi:HK97 family phage major capsid protein
MVPLEGETSIARLETDPTPQWRGENQEVTESEPTFGSATFKLHSLAVLVKCSREVLEDSANMEDALIRVFGASMGLELDRACMISEGAAHEPLGIANWDILEVEHDSAPNMDSLLEARTELLTANSLAPTAFLMHPRDEGALTMLKDGEGLPYPVPPALQGIPFLTTTQLPVTLGTGTDSMILAGDFKRALIGVRTDLRIEILKERYADSIQYGFLAWMRADLILEQPNAFVKITGVKAS